MMFFQVVEVCAVFGAVATVDVVGSLADLMTGLGDGVGVLTIPPLLPPVLVVVVVVMGLADLHPKKATRLMERRPRRVIFIPVC